MKHQVTSPVVDVYGVPDTQALRGKSETQLVLGEIFLVKEERNGWCQGLCAHDQYPGYIETRHLTKSTVLPTHIVMAARSHTYRDETMKSPLIQTLSFGSLITIIKEGERFAQLNTGAWIFKKHLSPLGALEKDPIVTAKKFLDTPYYWGGRSGFGLDCSGLVQVSLEQAGFPSPRDTEMQIEAVGTAADTHRTGDIIFFPGHVGMMVDDQNLIHATAFHMKTIIEPLSLVAERSEKADGRGITAIRRL